MKHPKFIQISTAVRFGPFQKDEVTIYGLDVMGEVWVYTARGIPGVWTPVLEDQS